MIESLVSTGSIAWLALAVLGLEFLIVLRLRRRRPTLLAFAANALSGGFLILALHAAVTGAGSGAIALWLGLGFVAHLGDTLIRLAPWPRQGFGTGGAARDRRTRSREPI